MFDLEKKPKIINFFILSIYFSVFFFQFLIAISKFPIGRHPELDVVGFFIFLRKWDSTCNGGQWGVLAVPKPTTTNNNNN